MSRETKCGFPGDIVVHQEPPGEVDALFTRIPDFHEFVRLGVPNSISVRVPLQSRRRICEDFIQHESRAGLDTNFPLHPGHGVVEIPSGNHKGHSNGGIRPPKDLEEFLIQRGPRRRILEIDLSAIQAVDLESCAIDASHAAEPGRNSPPARGCIENP